MAKARSGTDRKGAGTAGERAGTAGERARTIRAGARTAGARVARMERAEESEGHPNEVAPEKDDHREQRPEVHRHVEGEPEAFLAEAEEVLSEEEMPGAGDGQELREPLHDTEDNRLDQFEHAGYISVSARERQRN